MPPGFALPPLAFTGGLATGGTVAGGNWNQGAWNVNVAGSGRANQSATAAAGLSPMLIALVAIGAYLVLRK